MLDSDIAEEDYRSGLIASPPLWVSVIHTAKWLGVAPWDLASQEDDWREWALLLMHLEHRARERERERVKSRRRK